MSDGRATGDQSGIRFPAHPTALREDGVTFLTNAFRSSGALGDDNEVLRIDRWHEVGEGSTGRKVLLDVQYANPRPQLPAELFVKFSRDFDDPLRDRGKTQMEPEVRFATLALAPGFPIAVPHTLFADYHRDSGTGILITERIAFGANGIERQYHKCLDYEMPRPLDHYRALLSAVARLAGTHRSGRLPAHLTDPFPVDLRAATVGKPASPTPEKLDRRIRQVAEFARAHPGLVPANVRNPQFLAQIALDTQAVLRHEAAIWDHLADAGDYIALCHWNANVDNAWFWRDAGDVIRCGLMDWGCVSQMNVAMAIWGAMSGAETELWNQHFDDILDMFCTEFREAGGPQLDPATLGDQVTLYATLMGVTWLLDVPSLLRARLPDSNETTTRTDPRIRDAEGVRAPLQMLVNLLNLWQRRGLAKILAELGS